MTASSLLRQLHLKYADLAKRTKEALSPDEGRSLRYYVAEMALQEIGASVGRPADRVTAWAANLLELEEFVTRTGRLPRVNRRSGESATHAEVRLEQWLNFQTRPGTISRHCSYQTDRLAIIPGYSASRLEDRWQVRYDQYREFLGEQRRVPALRSTDSFEKSLAGWGAKQRLHRRNGSLPAHRVAALTRLEIWSWGASSKKATK